MNLPPWLLIVVILCFCVLLNFPPQLLIMVILCSREASSLALDRHRIVFSHCREPSRLLFIIVLWSHEPSSLIPNCHYVFMFL